MKKVVVLGAGLVGSVIAKDLSKSFKVTSVDLDPQALKPLKKKGIDTISSDISISKNLEEIIKDFDLIIGAVPGYMGYKMLETVINANKNIVDISFFPEDPFKLDELAKSKNVIAIMDCGVAPGMGNIILGHHHSQMKIDKYECLVGGLPVVREWPYEYKAVFSPIDVIEEYIRPSRFVQNHEMITRKALSDTELVYFDKVGTLESWNSDGLRTLINTMPEIPNMIEKTLRYPGCVEYIKVLRESGFFSSEPIEINGTKIRPIDLTSKLLFPKWKLQEGEEDFTVMRIIIKGKENNSEVEYQYDLYDKYQNNTISMARTTGYTCSAVAKLVLDKKYTNVGISPPEYLGLHFNSINEYLKERNVIYTVKKK